VAEFALGLMLVETRHIARAHHGIVTGSWFEIPNVRECFELSNKTIGLVGFGAVGRILARRLAGFEVRLLVYDPYVSPDIIRESGGEPAGLDELLRAADIVSLHARLTDSTLDMIGERELALMKRTAYLINTARAGLVNEPALVRALQARQIAGAALDVFWKEPIPEDSPLLRLENVTLTSHIAGTTQDSFIKSVRMVSQAALDCINGVNYDWVINLEVLKQEI
jgi:D-3-phosphoglycerate dehydrogenase